MFDKTPLRGVLHLFSESGTEGGFWAFQDERFIQPNTKNFRCIACGLFWDKERFPDGPPSTDKIPETSVRVEVFPLGKAMGCGTPQKCLQGKHVFELTSEELWSYEGLHVLQNGDKLTIFSKEDASRIAWSGEIRLVEFPVFTEDVHGFWIHADQVGVDRCTWASRFLEGYAAELIPCQAVEEN